MGEKSLDDVLADLNRAADQAESDRMRTQLLEVQGALMRHSAASDQRLKDIERELRDHRAFLVFLGALALGLALQAHYGLDPAQEWARLAVFAVGAAIVLRALWFWVRRSA